MPFLFLSFFVGWKNAYSLQIKLNSQHICFNEELFLHHYREMGKKGESSFSSSNNFLAAMKRATFKWFVILGKVAGNLIMKQKPGLKKHITEKGTWSPCSYSTRTFIGEHVSDINKASYIHKSTPSQEIRGHPLLPA
jgi:hypothetical protein